MQKLTRRRLLKAGAGFGVLTAIGGAGAIFTACGDDEKAPSTTGQGGTPASDGERVTISMIGWGGAPSEVWTKPLEDQLNVRINYKGVGSMVELVQLVQAAPAGTYDIAGIYNHEATPRLFEADLLLPLEDVDTSDLDEWSRPSDERTRGPEIFDGKLYYLRSHTEYQGMPFNKDTVSEDELLEKGYDILYEDKYKGKVCVWNDPIQTMPIFGFMLGLNPFDVTDEEFNQMKAKMMALAPQAFMVPAYGEGVTAMADGSAVLLGSMNGGASLPALTNQGVNAGVFFDKRGVLTPSEGVSVIAGSNNPERALAFAKAWVDPQTQANVAMKDAWSSPPSIPAAWDLIDKKILDALVVRYDKSAEKVVPKLGDPDWTLVDWISPINPTIDRWTDAWEQFRAAIG